MLDTNASELKRAVAPLYKKYPGQDTSQPAFIAVFCESRAVRGDWTGEIGNAVPAEVWRKRVLRFPVPSAIRGDVIADFLESEPFQNLVERILDGYETRWDGSNNVGNFSETAQKARDDLSELINLELWDDEKCSTPVDPEEYWYSSMDSDESRVEFKLKDYKGESVITKDTLNEELQVLAKELEDRIEPGWQYDGDVLTWLESLRDNLTE